MKRNILLCVAGLTPPIITETLYVLAIKRRIEIHEIQVITSTVGAKLVRERLFDSGHLAEFCCDYPTQTAKLRFDMDCLHILAGEEGQLPDIRTSLENEQAANQICRIVKKLTDDKTSQIYASVAGGRKTMGNYLAFAMSLFARTHDSLSHVLVDEEFERAGRPPLDFYYEPPIPRQVFDIKGIPIFTNNAQPLLTNMAKTTMAEIPFVRLRRILEENYGDGPTEYASFVQQVQDELDLLETEHVLEIFLAQNKIRIAKREIEFTPRDFWIYVIFALRRKKAETDKVAAIAYEDLTLEDFDAALRLITRSDGDESGLEKIAGDNEYEFLLEYIKRKEGKLWLDTNKLKKSLGEGITRINGNLKEEKIPVRYQIKAKTKSGKISFNWIALTPKKIKFVSLL